MYVYKESERERERELRKRILSKKIKNHSKPFKTTTATKHKNLSQIYTSGRL